MLHDFALSAIGIVLLWKGADWLVDGAASIARRLGVSSFVIGLTVVSFGTSAPEFIVTSLAATRGETELALGTIVGSNIANTTLILGIAAMISQIQVSKGTLRMGVPFTILITAIAFVLLNDARFDPGTASQLGRVDGIILLVLFALFMWHTAQRRRTPVATQIATPNATPAPHESTAAEPRLPRAILYTLAGVAGLALGGQFLVNGALALAATFGVSSGFVGFAIVAIGTSLPELAASAAGSWKKQTQLVVGNIIGSNIFNLLLILGITALIEPIPLGPDGNILLYGALGATGLLWLLLLRNRTITKTGGVVLATTYAIFLGIMLQRAF